MPRNSRWIAGTVNGVGGGGAGGGSGVTGSVGESPPQAANTSDAQRTKARRALQETDMTAGQGLKGRTYCSWTCSCNLASDRTPSHSRRMTNTPEQWRMGIDLGGTKIEGVILDARGEIVVRERIMTPRTYDATLDALTNLATSLEAQVYGRATVGLGIPGTMVPETGRVKNANSTWLIGEPLPADLEQRLGRPVRVENDANCFALSEAVDGAGADGRVVFGVIIGTGVGGGVVIDRQCLVGRNRVAGEWGHNPLPWPSDDERDGPPCYCGQRGCIETWISGPGIAADHTRRTGQVRDTSDLMRAALQGDAAAAETRDLMVHRAARSLATIVNVLDPDVIVLGGGVSNSERVAEDIQAQLSQWVFSDAVTTPVRRHVHGDSSGVRGAAWLWPPTHSTAETA